MAPPAMARDGQAYGGVSGGVLFGESLDVDVDDDFNGIFDDDELNLIELDTDLGWDVDAVLGYDFGMFRLEAEAAYKWSDVDRIRSAQGFDLNPDTDFVDTDFAVDGDLQIASLMANALVDLGSDDGVQFFAGGGAGYAWVGVEGAFENNPEPFIDDDKSGFAWQGLAGVRFPVGQNMDVGAKYRYFNVNDIGLRGRDGQLSRPTSRRTRYWRRCCSTLAAR